MQNGLNAFEVLAQNCFKKRYDDTKVYLMHSVTHVHEINTEMRSLSKGIQKEMKSCFFLFSFIHLYVCIKEQCEYNLNNQNNPHNLNNHIAWQEIPGPGLTFWPSASYITMSFAAFSIIFLFTFIDFGWQWSVRR